jgi:hypothetical protein
MAKATTVQKARAPQGTKRVAQAFLDELATIADDKQAEVGKAAQSLVRETLITQRDKAKAAKQKLRASNAEPAAGRRGAKAGRKKPAAASVRKPPRQRRGGSSQPESDETQKNTENAGQT